MTIIGICGKDNAGKDSLAAAIGGRILPFAGELKRIAGELYGLTPEQLHDPVQKEIVDLRWGLTPRHILRALGTEVARSVHPDTWVRAWERQVDALMLETGRHARLIAPDVRFDNEAAAIRSRGGKIVRVVRPLAEGADSPKDPEGVPQRRVSDHASNRDDIKPDLVITNDGSLDDLWRTGLWISGLFASPPHGGQPAPLPWRLSGGSVPAGQHPPQVATVGDFVGGDGVQFTLDHRPTCHRRGPWHLMIEVASGPHHHAWGCFDDQDQPSRWYHDQLTAQEEARRIAAVLVRDRWAWA